MGKKITISSIPMGTDEHGEEIQKYSCNGVYPIAGVRVRPGEIFEYEDGQDAEAQEFVEGHRGKVRFVDGRTKADITAASWRKDQEAKLREAKEKFKQENPPSPVEAQLNQLTQAVAALTKIVADREAREEA